MVWFVILAVITAGMALGLPPDPHTLQQLHITSPVYRIAILVVLIPYAVIWYAAFYAYAKLTEYVRAIRGTEDGEAFVKIMIGTSVLAFGLVVPTIIALILNNIAIHFPGFKPSSVIINHYLSLLVVLVTFVFIGVGARRLANEDGNRLNLIGSYAFGLLFLALAVFFTYLVMHYHVHHPNIYYLNTPLLLATLVVPYLFAWYIALMSAMDFWLYAKNVKGLLYKRALQQLAYGISIVILGSVSVQFVDNTIMAKASQKLSSVLALEYALFIIIAIGLIFMALGTNKLKKIEEV